MQTKTRLIKKSCASCLFRIKIDYTIEGMTNHCLLDKNPKMPEDNWFELGENNALNFICSSYKPCKHMIKTNNSDEDVEVNYSIHVDVDREYGALINYTDNKLLKALLEINPARVEQILKWGIK